MKRLLAALLTLFALLALTGCGGSSSDGPHLLLYYPAPSGGSPGGDAIVSRSVDWAANSTLPAEQQVRRVVSLLLEDSADGSLESPIPASTRLLACQVSAGAAWVDFSSAYGQLSGMELTIADYCVTLSLSQIVGIYSVRITVNGTELIYRDSNIFLAGDVLMTSQDDVVQNLSLRLYFPDRETGELTAEERLLTVYEGESQAEVILSALKAGPESESLSPLLPTGFAVLTVPDAGGRDGAAAHGAGLGEFPVLCPWCPADTASAGRRGSLLLGQRGDQPALLPHPINPSPGISHFQP